MVARKKSAIPTRIAPMLATLTKEVPDDPELLFEIKWDGYRIVSYVHKGKVRMDSRSALDYTKKYPPIADALKKLKHDVVVDGEVVVFNEEGNPDFDALQLYNGHTSPISYCIFDLLWLDGYSLMELPLEERKEKLRSLIDGHPVLRFSESFDDGAALYDHMLEKNLEGVVAKKRKSAYQPGNRGYDWLKIPTRKRQEFVIGGWAESDKARSFRSLLFGAYNSAGKLEWIGRSGGGYKEKEMPGILKQLQAIESTKSPFINKVLDTKGSVIHYTRPKLVANFEFATWTKSGRIRKPATFLGFRKDKNPEDVVREIPKKVSVEVVEPKQKNASKKKPASTASHWRDVERQKIEHESEIEIDGCSITLSDVDRHIWKDITKATLIEYYHSVAQYILPHIQHRPQSLHLKLNGANAPGLYIKDMEGRQPDCAEIYPDKRRHPKQGKRSVIDYLVCNNEATLLWMVNVGCIDINPWNSRVVNIEEPDYIVIDLDPSEKELSAKGLKRLRETALATYEYCHSKALTPFFKTSGKTGVHFLLPCSGFTYAQSRTFAEQISSEVQHLVPSVSTTTVSVSSRGDKVFIDPSQNDYTDTIAAPYSVRPYVVPTVSTPLTSRELKGLDPRDFAIHNIVKRLKSKKDLFEKISDPAIIKRNNKVLLSL